MTAPRFRTSITGVPLNTKHFVRGKTLQGKVQDLGVGVDDW